MSAALQVLQKTTKEPIIFTVRDDLGLVMSSEKIQQWETDRTKTTIPALRRFGLKFSSGVGEGSREKLLNSMHEGKTKLTEVTDPKRIWSWQTPITNYVSTYGISKSNPEKPNHSFVSLFIPRCSAKKFVEWYTKVIRSNLPEDQAYFLATCPDHYFKNFDAVKSRLEIAEVTGGSYFINHYYIALDDESGVKIPPDEKFPEQFTGTAYLMDGTKLGGLRYQFRNLDIKGVDTCEACIYVDFPEYTPKWIFVEHQMHLACEWSQWFRIFLALQEAGQIE